MPVLQACFGVGHWDRAQGEVGVKASLCARASGLLRYRVNTRAIQSYNVLVFPDYSVARGQEMIQLSLQYNIICQTLKVFTIAYLL